MNPAMRSLRGARLLHTSAPLRAAIPKLSPQQAKVMQELNKNPEALKLVKAMQQNAPLARKMAEFSQFMVKKGYIDPADATKQPGFSTIAKMMADSEARQKLQELGAALKSAGINPETTGMGLSSLFGSTKSGGSAEAAPKAAPAAQSAIEGTSTDASNTAAKKPSITDRLKGMFKA
ncbi:uncharacterized protein BJ171DRAFT_488868 [Polychytrium aggregatum]|uniref:uncharacterized protein n=1 Tax=Polychytrium aggregatum TaxID=110093 RepID=UPI0022FECF1F|nr:uncharacterized protein BJ171DRAFT_488868 [Polychytrium aggregatum]KAI9208422.1 hypothetical protein BJ171DRAFT_488868 [Polychytrium aggregatum]